MLNTTNYLKNANQNENEILFYIQEWQLFKKKKPKDLAWKWKNYNPYYVQLLGMENHLGKV